MVNNRQRQHRNRQPAYLLLPTILTLTLIGLMFFLQTKIFHQKLHTQLLLLKITTIDTKQIEASRLFCQDNQQFGQIQGDSWVIEPEKRQIKITSKNQDYYRPLLTP
ncbi:hypothetical protein [Fructobacillus americanaquae]|uniref:Uncharacterized protein n=1 Tax=Fructobacillus americanaquae TaxID=2940302 RepID=A0ABY5C1Q8_9LACO|nr:hypothetical protein [Fructobacillus americanaquae]USS91783.1 hypothetical protein M3M36_05570 [Fructobacillus americanaquae]